MFVLPCNSARHLGSRPERLCRPSVFWLTTNFTRPSLTSLTIAICDGDGTAFNTFCTFFCWEGNLMPWALRSHTPGPVVRTVFTPLLKSGIPVLVLIPAPVKTIQYRLSRIHWARTWIFSDSTSSSSKYSFFSNSLDIAFDLGLGAADP